MYLEIVSPEATLFSSEVDSVAVPGVNGEFQMLNNHAPVVSILKSGTIRIYTHTQSHLVFDELHAEVIPHNDDNKILTVSINSGTIEMKDNKLIILAD
ncbi:F0F1 ATP synthase subunit epsilon [Winogradskyella sp.]|nr:F0F1 ATP synthase subunit epsilon [Winogradskyella sp.]MDB9781712.1 F0F1 ATP synthase subunit epsilon [Winogradskyella sp.]MDC0006436.1 F0F1 ATP synthase subunit epsilon [Winogradskyella sp.]MDC0009130.1 F0F1 ATP synthase subunit epsilon [Winogradskyella sp.]MDC1503820.1 F0F1 ATP synthase subunit epsilon [Winogradskyella sp.]